MKRLLAQIGITYLSVLAVVFYFGKIALFSVLSVSLILLVLFLVISKCRRTVYLPFMAAFALVACISNLLYTNCYYNKIVEEYDTYSGSVVATLKEEPYKNYDVYYYRFNCSQVGSQKCDFDFVTVHNELLTIEPYDTIKANLTFDSKVNNLYLSRRCFLKGSFGYSKAQYKVIGSEDRDYKYYAIKIRQSIRNKLDSVLSQDAFALSSALLIGDKHALSDQTRQAFVRAGASHLVVVSGMHFSILASVFFLFAKKYRRYRMLSVLPATLFIVFYMAVTGFSPSVMRSGIMMLVYSVGIMASRDSYSPNSLGLASLAVTITNPYSVGNVGLILSFATTFSILKLSPILQEKFSERIKNDNRKPTKSRTVVSSFITRNLRKIRNYLISFMCMSISAYAVSLPLSMFLFKAAPTLSVISSFVLYFPVVALMMIALLTGVLSLIPFMSFVLPLLSSIASWITDIALVVVNFFAQLEFSYIKITYNFVYVWMIMSIVIAAILLFSQYKKRIRLFALCCIVIFLVGYISADVLSQDVATINVYDADGGTAVVYTSQDTNAVLSLDCNRGNAYSTINKLENTVTKIDFASSVADNLNSMHSLASLSKMFAIDDVLLYDTKRTVNLPQGTKVTKPAKYQKVVFSDDTVVNYYFVKEDYIIYLENDNFTLLVLPQYIDVVDIPQQFRSASVIVMGNCPLNFELLSCDTLVITAKAEAAYNIMKFSHVISNRVYLTAEKDVILRMGV